MTKTNESAAYSRVPLSAGLERTLTWGVNMIIWLAKNAIWMIAGGLLGSVGIYPWGSWQWWSLFSTLMAVVSIRDWALRSNVEVSGAHDLNKEKKFPDAAIPEGHVVAWRVARCSGDRVEYEYLETEEEAEEAQSLLGEYWAGTTRLIAAAQELNKEEK